MIERQVGRQATFSLVGLIAAAALCPQAHAATTGPVARDDKDEGSESGLAEIVITAERRPTLLQDTPIAVTAISASEIERRRIVNLADAQLSVPSLTYVQITHQEAFLSIRGTSIKQDAPGTDLGVSVFIDDVPTTGIGDNDPNLFDLQSIEVLRGPQGTLFGRNTTGGAVLIHTAPPSFEPEVKAQATYGTYNLFEARVLGTGPIIADVLAGKISLESHRRDDYVTNVTLHDKNNGENMGSARGQLLWTPSGALRLVFSADFNRDTSQSRVGAVIANFHPSLFPTLQFGPTVTNDGFDPQGRKTTAGLSAKVDWTIPVGTITSISGYRYVDESQLYDVTGDPPGSFRSTISIKDRQYTEELHFASPAEELGLNWLGGLFYLRSDRRAPHHFDINVTPGTLLSHVDPYSVLTFGADQNQAVSTTSAAAFGEVSYAFITALKLTLGGRYTHESKSGHSEVFDTSGLSPVLDAVYSHTWSAFTPKANLSFEPTKHFLMYANVAEGFQSGGYDISASTVAGLEKPFNPEKVLSYELGTKVSALDSRLQLNLSVFRANYTDLQRTAYDAAAFTQVTKNAGKARVQGIEVEAALKPLNWLRLGTNYTFTDAKYTDYVDPNDPGPPIVYTGNTLPNVAKHQFHASAELIAPVSGGEMSVGADITIRSRTHLVDANDEPSYVIDQTRFKALTNVHAGWESADEHFQILVWGKNLTNERSLLDATGFLSFYATPAEYFSGGNSIYHAFYTEPRTFGVTVTFRR
jgi:iron complex outermembrane recepter protein